MPDLTITLSPAQAARVAAAFGHYLRLGRDATVAEVKQFLILELRGVVHNRERADQEALVVVVPFDPS